MICMLQKEYGLTYYTSFQFIEHMKDQSDTEGLYVSSRTVMMALTKGMCLECSMLIQNVY